MARALHLIRSTMMMMTKKSVGSFLGVFLAAVASVATSAPEPDWTMDDKAEGEITLSPDQEETVLELRVTSEVVRSSLDVTFMLEPAPTRAVSEIETPILLFVSSPTEAGESSSLHALPESGSRPMPDGYSDGMIEPKEGARDVEIRFAWTSPNRYAYDGYDSLDGGERIERRPVAERRFTTIKWKASIHAQGYDDRPRGAKVDVEAAW